MKNIDKSKYKNWIEGDIFAVKIENTNTIYDNRYFILIKCAIKEIEELLGNSLNMPYFYVKLTTDDSIPLTKEEVESLEYVKIDYHYWNERYFPTSGLETFEELKKRKKDLKFYPDENMYLYSYIYELWIRRGADMGKFIYIGNFQVTPPFDNFIPRGVHLDIYDKKGTKEFVEYLIKCYENYNKKKSSIYTEEGLRIAKQRNEEAIRETISDDLFIERYRKTEKNLTKEEIRRDVEQALYEPIPKKYIELFECEESDD